MFNAFDNVFEFLITIIFNLFIFVLLLRALMQWSGVHYLNPLAQLSIKLTDWCVKPLRLFLPIFYRVDSGIVLLVWFAEILKYICLLAFTSQSYPLAAIIVVSFFDILRLLINIFFYAIIIRAIISWLGQIPYNPVIEIVFHITEPLLAPARRIVPMISGIDFSPLLVIILLQVINIFLGSLY